MPHTLFISDLHLDEKHTTSYIHFKCFMQEHAPFSEALYILGDFFEVWVGDDHLSPFNELVKAELKALARKIPVFFLHGNRDFLIGNKFAQETGCHLLPEFSVIKPYGEPIILLHGDALSMHDIKHMKFRKLTQSIFLKKLFLLLPLAVRLKIAFQIRKTSKQHYKPLSNELLDGISQTAKTIFKSYQANKMVHGHFHQSRVFQNTCDGISTERIILGSWDQQGCALKWYANGKREVLFL